MRSSLRTFTIRLLPGLISFVAMVFICMQSHAQFATFQTKWVYSHPEMRYPNSDKNMPLFGKEIDSEHEKPDYIIFYKDSSFEGRYLLNHKAILKFGNYKFIGDGKYIEITFRSDDNKITIERHEIIELKYESLKLKYKGLIFVYKNELQ